MTQANEKINFFKIVRMPIFLALIGVSGVLLSFFKSLYPRWESGPHYINLIGIVLLTMAVALFSYNLLFSLLKFYENKYSNNRLGYSLLKTIRKALPILFTLMLIKTFIGFISVPFFYLQIFYSVLNIALILSVGWVAMQFLSALEYSAYQYSLNHPGEYQIRAREVYTKIHILKNIGNMVIMVLVIAAILMTFSSVKNIGVSILASAGFITALIGLAAQKTTSSMFASLQLALNQVIKIGDYVVVKDIKGVIEEITFTYVSLISGDHRIILPISTFLDQPFENWSRTSNIVGSLKLEFADNFSLEALRAEIDLILNQSEFWDKKIKTVVVSDWRWKDKNRIVELTIAISADDTNKIDALKNEIREKLLVATQTYSVLDPVPEKRASINSSA